DDRGGQARWPLRCVGACAECRPCGAVLRGGRCGAAWAAPVGQVGDCGAGVAAERLAVAGGDEWHPCAAPWRPEPGDGPAGGAPALAWWVGDLGHGWLRGNALVMVAVGAVLWVGGEDDLAVVEVAPDA